MRHVRIAEQALRAASDPSRQQYICRSCLAQAARQLHTTSQRSGPNDFLSRISKTIFGDKKAEEKQKRLKEAAAARGEVGQEVVESSSTNLKAKVKINGITYERATRVDPATNKDYLPSTTWDGLERVGGEQWVKKRLDMGEQYSGFLPNKKTELTNTQWQRLLHGIAVEIAALRHAGRSTLEVCNAHPKGSLVEQTTKARLSQAEDGTLQVKFASPQEEEAVLAGIESNSPFRITKKTKQKVDLERSEIKPADLVAELAQITKSQTDVEWLDISLQDPELKLAIAKRAMQLSGKHIPDIQLNNATTLGDIYDAFRTKEKAKKLAHAPQLEELAQTLPNVTVYKTRRTPVHKEKQIGRWKVIEEELSTRDLPIFGSRWQNAKEGLRLHEK